MFYLPQLRNLDGQEVTYFEKCKADILFGADVENRKDIFRNFLPEENFIDRRLFVSEQIDPESDSDDELNNLEMESFKVRSERMLSNFSLSSIPDKKTK